MLVPGAVEEVPLWLTVLCGVGGMLLGDWLYTRLWDAYTPGVDWWRHGWQVATAAVLVAAVSALVVRRRRAR